MNNQLPKLLSEVYTFLRLIPPGYRWILALVALLVIGLIVAVILVSPPAPLKALPPVLVAEPVPLVPAAEDPVKELFDPNIQQTAAQQHQAAVLSQIDNILLNSYVLNKCNKLKAEEYSDTYQLLLTYAKMERLALSTEAADAVVRERAKAAAATYSLVYSNVSCGDIEKERMLSDLETWRRNMRLAPIRPQP